MTLLFQFTKEILSFLKSLSNLEKFELDQDETDLLWLNIQSRISYFHYILENYDS